MKLKLLFLLLVFQVSVAQHRTCGVQEKMQQIMNDPVQRQAYLDQQAKFGVELQKLATNNFRIANTIITIPVAVHFPAVATTSTLKACFRTLAQSQINILNADYNAANADISNFVSDAAFYPGTNTGNLQVQFVLATQNHPAGTGIAEGTVAVTFGTDFLGSADTDSTWAGYLNLVCRNAGTGILGYSPLGGSPSSGMTVVIAKAAFGSGSGCTGYVPTSPYNLGRTLTHELGHYFNLDHTFGPYGEGNGCVPSNTDYIADTPQEGTDNYGCPAAGDIPGCVGGEYALTMDYMDYVDDAMHVYVHSESSYKNASVV